MVEAASRDFMERYRLAARGMYSGGGEDLARWRKVVRETGIKIE